MSNLLATALADPRLMGAWDRVRAKNGGAGVDGVSVEAFSSDVRAALARLRESVLAKDYRPQPLLGIALAKPDGGTRSLAIPCVRDRVLQTAVARTLAPRLERHLEDASWAYRVGRSAKMALARVAHYRDQGYRWALEADIRSFFDEIDHDLLRAKLTRTLDDASPLPLIDLWLAAIIHPAKGGQRRLVTRGVPQGSPISPLLSNLYLDDFDEALLERDLKLVRYADDFLVLCRDETAAHAALDLVQNVVARLRLALKPEKTRVVRFDDGFRFLGVEFIGDLMRPLATATQLPGVRERAALDRAEKKAAPNVAPTYTTPPEPETYVSPRDDLDALPGIPESGTPEPDADHASGLALEENPALEPILRSLIVTEHGLTLLKEGERVLIARGRTPVASVPLHGLDQIVVHGNHLVSTALLHFAHTHGLAVSFAERHGRPIGRFDNRKNFDLALHRRQFEREKEPGYDLMFARAVVSGKIHNQRLVLRRFNRRRELADVRDAEAEMSQLETRLETARDLNAIRGVEGRAARCHFQALQSLVPEHWGFSGRHRNPPTDPFNVLISYGYGMLFNVVHTLIERRGLNAWLGALHANNGRQPALVCDLVEEFRAPLVDAVALHALLNVFQPGDFLHDGGDTLPCRLTDAARKRFLVLLQAKFRSGLVHPRSGQRIDHHRLIQYQVHHYARVVLGEEPLYRACRLK